MEAIITSSSKKNRATFVIENGVSLLKQLYKVTAQVEFIVETSIEE